MMFLLMHLIIINIRYFIAKYKHNLIIIPISFIIFENSVENEEVITFIPEWDIKCLTNEHVKILIVKIYMK